MKSKKVKVESKKLDAKARFGQRQLSFASSDVTLRHE
jgi:hypothetical protein